MQRLEHVLIVNKGNIASGKTNLTHLIKDFWGFEEILERWKKSVLERYYSDRKKHGYATQRSFMRERAKALRAAVERPGLYVADYEFGVDSSVYAKNLLTEGVLTHPQFEQLCLYEREQGQGLPQPDLLVYLTTQVDVLQERIRRRGRPAEAGLLTNEGREYLLRLEDLHRASFAAYPGKKAELITDHLALVPEWNFGNPPRTNIEEALDFIRQCLHHPYDSKPFRFEKSFG